MEKRKETVSRLGTLLKNIPYEHGKEYERVFNLAHNTFFQKLVPLKLVECGFNIESKKYFGMMIYLDYLINVLLGEDKVLGNLKTIYEHLEEREKNFKLSSDLVILESVLTAKELVSGYKNRTGKDYFKECAGDMKERYNQQNYVIDFKSKSIRQTDPYYNAVGLRIYNIFSDENKDELSHVCGREDLKALLFTDHAMRYVKDKGLRKKLRKKIKKHDYFTASIIAIDSLQKEASISLEEFKQKAEG